MENAAISLRLSLSRLRCCFTLIELMPLRSKESDRVSDKNKLIFHSVRSLIEEAPLSALVTVSVDFSILSLFKSVNFLLKQAGRRVIIPFQ